MDTNHNGQTTGRRVRTCTPQEQSEFMRLGKQLLESGTAETELQQELGYETPEGLRTALDTGRASTLRLERVRALAQARLPALIEQKTAALARQSEERVQRMMEQFRSRIDAVEATGPRRPVAPSPPARAAASAGAAGGTRKRTRSRGRGSKMEHLSERQHVRLREQIEHLWAVDKRFRNWSLLAKVGGLGSGQAMKRAYDVGSSLATLQNVDRFARLHAAYGSRATLALKTGVPPADLQAHLAATAEAESRTAGRPGAGVARDREVHGTDGEAAAAGAGQRGPDGASVRGPDGASVRGTSATRAGASVAVAAEQALAARDALEELTPTPPTVDFSTMVELGEAIDVEVRRMWQMAQFFDGVSRTNSLPRTIRSNAALTRDHLTNAISFFAPEGVEG